MLLQQYCSLHWPDIYLLHYGISLTADTSHIEAPNPGYLKWVPTNLVGNETKIFLVSTDNSRYDDYNWNDSRWDGGEVHEGDPCFIVNVTVRNDYTTAPLWTDADSPLGMYNKYVKLTAYLYNQQDRVDSVDVTYPIIPFMVAMSSN